MGLVLAQIAKSVGTEERTLRRAIADGTIHAVPSGARSLVVTAEEAEYVRRHWAELGTLRRLLRTETNVALAMVFGSFARGEEGGDSDLDLVIALRRPDPLGLDRLCRRLQPHLRRPLQLVAFADVEHSPSMLYELLRDGRVLVDREERWPALQARRRSVARAARAEGRLIEDEARRAVEYFSAIAQQGEA